MSLQYTNEKPEKKCLKTMIEHTSVLNIIACASLLYYMINDATASVNDRNIPFLSVHFILSAYYLHESSKGHTFSPPNNDSENPLLLSIQF